MTFDLFKPSNFERKHRLFKDRYCDYSQQLSLDQDKIFIMRISALWSTVRDPKTHRVTAVHVSNGGNNVAVYIPLFASSSLASLSVILTMCYMTIGFWCFCSYNLTRFPGISILIARYGRKIAPFILIWLGLSIIMKNESYRLVLPI